MKIEDYVIPIHPENNKNVLKSIEESNRRYYKMLMQSPFAFSVMKGKEMVVTMANDRMKEFWGKGKDVEGKTLLEILPELKDQSFPALIDEVYTTGIPYHSNEILAQLKHDGKLEDRYFNIVYQPYLEADDSISGVTTIAYEVTEQVLARKKIEANANFNRTVLESNPDCVKIIDYEGRVVFMNMNGLCSLDIDDFNTIKNKYWWELWGIENQQMVKEAVSKALNGGIAHFQAMDRTLKGSEKWWDVIVSPVVQEDNPRSITRLISVSRDITEQQQATRALEESEHRYRNMVHSSPFMISILKGEKFIIESANDAILNAWGKGKEVIGKSILDEIPEIIDQGFGDILHDVYTTGITYQAHEMPVYVDRFGKTELNYYTFIYQVQRNVNNVIDGIAIVAHEVTPQAEINKKIKESEERYHNLICSSPIAIAILEGPELIITTANDAIKEIWGKGMDVEGKPFFDLMPEFKEQGYKEIYDHVYTSGNSYTATETAIQIERNGKTELQYYNFLLHAQRNIEGEIEGVSIITSEVTSHALLNKTIKASEAQFRLLVQQAPVAICVLRGEDYVIEVINEPMSEMWGRDIQDVINQPAFTVLSELKDQGFKELLDHVYTTGERFVAEELPISLQRNGKLENAFVKFVYEPLREADGTISGVMALAHEITDQVNARKRIEESELHFRQLADLMPAKISNADTEGNVLYFNKHWLDYTGKNFEELKNFGYHTIMHPDEVGEFQKRFKAASESGTELEMEMRFLNKEGEYKWHLNLASPIKDLDGKITKWVGSTTEIHEQIVQKDALEKAVKERTKELETANKELVVQNLEKEKRGAELKIANKQLQFQNEEKEKRASELLIANNELEAFTYVSSHDLQEPLRKIQTFATIILEKENLNLSENGKYIFERMKSAASRMQQLIQDLLGYSRLNTAERKFVRTDLGIIIDDVTSELAEVLEEKNVTIDSSELCTANIIPFQFRQLIHNLISNAIKFSKPQAPPHIIIQSKLIPGSQIPNPHLSPDKIYCHISFQDHGIGFEPQFSKRIFELFQKLHSKDEFAGTGIGLAIVKKIVDNHNGIITATSELGMGTTFDIYLPA